MRFVTAMLGVATLCGPAWGETIQFHGKLTAAAEVPAKSSQGSGDATATLDSNTKTLTYTVTYEHLTGPATMAHFHGPAAPGVNAGVVVPFPNAASPIHGTATLTDAQIADLEAGKWYANVHTKENPAGEIRGQMEREK
jgi:hypothetical protein